MPKPCILVSSCRRDQANGYNDAVRLTWAADKTIPCFFIVGDGGIATRDTVKLNVPDDYLGLTFKTKESLAWAIRNGFTHVFRSFTDTYVDVKRLADSNFADHDYTGNRSDAQAGGYRFAHGGPGYWLGPRAIHILLDAPIEKEKYDWHKFEDQWVGSTLHSHGIVCVDDKRYSMSMSYLKSEADPLEDNDLISAHLSNLTNQYHPDWMREVHSKRYGLDYKPTIAREKGCMCENCIALKMGQTPPVWKHQRRL
jgi:hypothetical protein